MYNIKTKIEQGCAPDGLQDLYLWQALVNIVNERISLVPTVEVLVLTYPGGSTTLNVGTYPIPQPIPSLIPFPQVGDDLQNKPAYYLHLMQRALFQIISYFSNTTLTQYLDTSNNLVFFGDTPNEINPSGQLFNSPAGTPLGGGMFAPMIRAVWNFDTIRAAAGLPQLNTPLVGAGGPQPEAGGSNSGPTNLMFARYKPREITTAAATVDVDNNAATYGQVAHNLDDLGRTYQCQGSGNWTRNDNLPCDVIDNIQAPPNSIPWPALSGDLGLVRVGDYILWQQLEEIRQIANQLTEVWHDNHGPFVGMTFTNFQTSSKLALATVSSPTNPSVLPTTMATAFAAAQAAIVAAPPPGLVSGSVTNCTYEVNNFAVPWTHDPMPVVKYQTEQDPVGPPGTVVPTNFQLQAISSDISTTIQTTKIQHTVKFFGFICSSISGDGVVAGTYDAGSGDPNIYQSINDQGESGVTDLTYHQFHSVSSSTNLHETYQFLDSTFLPPNRPGYINVTHTPNNYNIRNWGWSAQGVFALVNYKQGLQYKF